MNIQVEISAGELIDKITILEIKLDNIREEAKLANIRTEHGMLSAVRRSVLDESPELEDLAHELKGVNAILWRIEDDIRDCERSGDFGQRFVQLARSVYRTNDRRAEIKRLVNDLQKSTIVEEKSYSAY